MGKHVIFQWGQGSSATHISVFWAWDDNLLPLCVQVCAIEQRRRNTEGAKKVVTAPQKKILWSTCGWETLVDEPFSSKIGCPFLGATCSLRTGALFCNREHISLRTVPQRLGSCAYQGNFEFSAGDSRSEKMNAREKLIHNHFPIAEISLHRSVSNVFSEQIQISYATCRIHLFSPLLLTLWLQTVCMCF